MPIRFMTKAQTGHQAGNPFTFHVLPLKRGLPVQLPRTGRTLHPKALRPEIRETSSKDAREKKNEQTQGPYLPWRDSAGRDANHGGIPLPSEGGIPRNGGRVNRQLYPEPLREARDIVL